MDRTTARESAMKLVYENLMGGVGGDETCKGILGLTEGETDYDFMQQLVQSAIENADKSDELIERYSNGWKTARMSRVDLSILRLAVCELMKKETPCAVVINEAVEMAKKFSGEKAAPFINGILGSIVREEL